MCHCMRVVGMCISSLLLFTCDANPAIKIKEEAVNVLRLPMASHTVPAIRAPGTAKKLMEPTNNPYCTNVCTMQGLALIRGAS